MNFPEAGCHEEGPLDIRTFRTAGAYQACGHQIVRIK